MKKSDKREIKSLWEKIYHFITASLKDKSMKDSMKHYYDKVILRLSVIHYAGTCFFRLPAL